MMEVTLVESGKVNTFSISSGSTIRQVLDLAKIHPSTVIVSFDDTVLPHSTILKQDITLELTIVSSGG
jgi:sulfur carrier protein ThiS